MSGSDLKSGKTLSCGCYNLELKRERATKHGHAVPGARSRLYNIWCGMRSRCYNSNNPDYKNYGGRGITICKEWDEYLCFYNWAISNGYDDHLSIDRVDVNGNYEPNNCRWADDVTQGNNRTNNRKVRIGNIERTISEWASITNNTSKSISARIDVCGWSQKDAVVTPPNQNEHRVSYNGETHSLVEWAEITGINYQTLRSRLNLYGWSFEKAINTPVKKARGEIVE